MEDYRLNERISVSSCGHYLARCTSDETLRIWNVHSGKQEHKFHPSKQLATPISCLEFVRKGFNNKAVADRALALGTVDGRLLLYDWSAGTVIKDLAACSAQSCVTSLRWLSENVLIVLTQNKILSVWNMITFIPLSEFPVRGDSCLSALSSATAAVASQSIEVISVRSQQKVLSDGLFYNYALGTVLQRFTGHPSNTSRLIPFGNHTKGKQYLFSSSHEDSFVRVWKVNPNANGAHCPPSAIIKAEEQVANIIIGGAFVVIISITGTLRYYRHKDCLNGTKPLLAVGTLKIFSDESRKHPVPIVHALNITGKSFCIAYGTGICLQFETLKTRNLEGQICLVRSINDADQAENKAAYQLATDQNHEGVTHVTPAYMLPVQLKHGKRKLDSDAPTSDTLPMEEILISVTGTPAGGSTCTTVTRSMANLLTQGLNSSDEKLLLRVFATKNEDVIEKTVEDLPITAVVPLIQELSKKLQSHWHQSRSYSIWLRKLLIYHKSYIQSLPQKRALMQPFLNYCAQQRAMVLPMERLKLRLDKKVHEITNNRPKIAKTQSYKPLFIFTDDDEADITNSDTVNGITCNGSAEVEPMDCSDHSEID